MWSLVDLPGGARLGVSKGGEIISLIDIEPPGIWLADCGSM